MLQQALNAGTVQEEEALWTQIIQKYGSLDANWVPDLVSWGGPGALGTAGCERAARLCLDSWLAEPLPRLPSRRWAGRGATAATRAAGRCGRACTDLAAWRQQLRHACWHEPRLFALCMYPPPSWHVTPPQGKLREALEDYNRSIQLCPWSVDPVLNRCCLAGARACCSAALPCRCPKAGRMPAGFAGRGTRCTPRCAIAAGPNRTRH